MQGAARGRRGGGVRLAALAILLAVTAACDDAALGVLDSGYTRHVAIDLDGPVSGLGAWRYYDGVRLLECDVVLEARGEGGSSGTSAEWLDGAIDLYDLRTGTYLGTDYMYAGEVRNLWGDAEIRSGERQVARPLRYSSYGPFRAHVTFYYESGSEAAEATHRFDCR